MYFEVQITAIEGTKPAGSSSFRRDKKEITNVKAIVDNLGVLFPEISKAQSQLLTQLFQAGAINVKEDFSVDGPMNPRDM